MTKKNQTLRPFNIIAKPAGPVCNLACEYCYYLEKEILYNKKIQKDYFMTSYVLESYIEQYINAQPIGTKEINFLWQGGEPTLIGLEFYKTVILFQKKYMRTGIRITNSIQTNGTLITEEMAGFFADNDFLVGISIDGPENLHNKFRKTKDDMGSFSKVMRGLEMLKKHKVEFNTLTVVQSNNSLKPEAIYSFLKSIGSVYMQFIPIVERLDSGKVSSRTVQPDKWGSFINGIFDLWLKHDIGKVFIGHFDMLLGLHAGYPSSLCVHAKTCGSALALEHNGDLYSCDHFVFKENKIGNITKQKMYSLVSSPKQQNFGMAKFNNLPNKCLKCGFIELCFGGCPKNRIIETDSGELNYLCEGYKMIYNHSWPFFQAMARAVQKRRPAEDYKMFL